MIITGFDVETTGLSHLTHRVVEVGAVLWDTDLKNPIEMFDCLVWANDYPEMEVEAQSAHGITVDLLQKHGLKPSTAFEMLNTLMSLSEAVVAHNGNRFDKLFYESEMSRLQRTPIVRPWVDMMTDVPFPVYIQTRKLTYLAVEHGFINPFAHRAVFDVMTMLMILSEYDVEAIVKLSQERLVTLKALVSFELRQLAKDRGYKWLPDATGQKIWQKSVRESLVQKEREEAGFPVMEVMI